MLTRCTLGALVLTLIFGGFVLIQSAPPAASNGDAKRIGELIRQLGSTKFQERTSAQKELEAIGAPALEQLKNAAKNADLETSKRAGELVRKMEEKIQTAALLAPKRVRLKVVDMPVAAAVEELAKISGYPIQLQGDRTKIADKKITLDTGDVTFFQALDQLCAKAGLAELPNQTGAPNPGLILPDVPRLIGPPVKIRPPINKAPVPPGAQPLPVEKVPKPKKPIDAQAAPAPAQVAQAQAVEVKAGVAVQAVQVQVLPAQVQQVQIQPVFPGFGGPTRPGINPAQIVLVPGTAKKDLTSYAGAVRVRVLTDVAGAKRPGEYLVSLDVAAEPRLQGFTMVGSPVIDKAIDDQGQKLDLATDPLPQNPTNPALPGGGIQILPAPAGMSPMGGMAGQRQVQVRFKAGDKESKSLKELSGTISAQALTPPEALITLENVLKATGETAKGKNGGAIRLTAIDKQANGDYRVQVAIDWPPGQNPFGNAIWGNGVIQIQAGVMIAGGRGYNNAGNLPDLLDAKGNKFRVVQIPSRRMNFNNGQTTQEVTLVFRGGNGQGDPDRLVLTGSRLATLTIPFSFQNVPLR